MTEAFVGTDDLCVDIAGCFVTALVIFRDVIIAVFVVVDFSVIVLVGVVWENMIDILSLGVIVSVFDGSVTMGIVVSFGVVIVGVLFVVLFVKIDDVKVDISLGVGIVGVIVMVGVIIVVSIVVVIGVVVVDGLVVAVGVEVVIGVVVVVSAAVLVGVTFVVGNVVVFAVVVGVTVVVGNVVVI